MHGASTVETSSKGLQRHPVFLFQGKASPVDSNGDEPRGKDHPINLEGDLSIGLEENHHKQNVFNSLGKKFV